jgi:hypothetical protein
MTSGGIKIDWPRDTDQSKLRAVLKTSIQHNATLPISISLHNMRRGGAFHHAFQSPSRRFDFQELVAW